MAAATSFPKSQIKVLLLEGVHQTAIDAFHKAGYDNVELLPSALSEEELIERISDVHLLGIRSKTKVTAKVLEKAGRLLAVACFCIGTNQVDLEKATERGVAVFNSPYSNTRSVAELVVAECVMLMRRIPERSHAAHKGVWMKDAHNSYELRGKTLGIIGYGHIGSQVSVLAEGFGMKVLYYDVIGKLPLGNASAISSMDELLAVSDVITLHVPEDPSTRNMFREEHIRKMKKGSFLLNLSRGKVVDIDALAAAIQDGHIAGTAVDVFPEEPKSKDEEFKSPLQGLKNVILTPHIGGSTQEAQENIGSDAASKLISYVDTGRTMGCHSVPELNLTNSGVKANHRILHIHENVPGVLSSINSALSSLNVNILGQYLKTNEQIGYVVLDVEDAASPAALEGLKNLPATIKARVLY